jgi:hypothetical protein
VIGRYLWELVDDQQTANWGIVNNTQSTGWACIDDTQTPNWGLVNNIQNVTWTTNNQYPVVSSGAFSESPFSTSSEGATLASWIKVNTV